MISFRSLISLILLSLFIYSCSATEQLAVPEPVSVAAEAPVTLFLFPEYEPVEAGRFDNGRMWTFEYPPADYFRTTYSFEPDKEWFNHAMLSSVRLPNCSGSFVSPNGLVMTNHHCAREQISQVSREGEQLLDEGFYAERYEEERVIEGYYVDQLLEVRDVTDRILSVVDAAPESERMQVRQAAVNELQEELQSEMDESVEGVVQVVSLYNGARYSAYFYRRYSDVRMVMAPELQIGYFGGDTDNFTYPRYNLDMTFLRVYDGDEPLETAWYFPFSDTGVEEGDAVFMIGNPGSTSRQETVTQLSYRALFSDYYRYQLIRRVAEALQSFSDIEPEAAEEMDLRNFIFSLRNAEKLYGGQILALQDPHLMGRRTDHEMQFRSELTRGSELAERYLPVLERIDEIQHLKTEYAVGYYPSLGISPNSYFSSATLQRALYAALYVSEIQNGADPADLGGYLMQIRMIEDKPLKLEEYLLTQRLHLFADAFGAGHHLTEELLQGRTPEEQAARIINHSSFVNSESTALLLELYEELPDLEDPAFELAAMIAPIVMDAQQNYGSLMMEEVELMSEAGRAWYEVYGTTIPPDATFSLRISDGKVSSYEYNGTVAPAYTTFYGLYDRTFSHVGEPEWALPERWLTPPAGLDLSTPVNFVSTNDIIGGNSGSPVVNVNLEVVGLAFDSNIEGMGSSDFILDDRSARAVSADVRGMLEALIHVYQAHRLVQEIRGSR